MRTMAEQGSETGDAAPHASEADRRGARIASEVKDWLGMDPLMVQDGFDLRRAAIDCAVAEFAPLDEVEGMLLSQMLTAHSMAMNCFRRTANPDHSDRVRASELLHAGRLIALCSRHADRLQRTRDWLERKAHYRQCKARFDAAGVPDWFVE